MRRPRVGIDARMVGPRPAGLARYARELVAHLPNARPDFDFIVLKRPIMARERLSDAANVTEVLVPGELDHPANLAAGRAINRLGLDLYHSLHHFLPLGITGPRVLMTLHDLMWVEHAELASSNRAQSVLMRAYGTGTMWHALRRADHVISITEATRQRAIERFGVPPARLSVVWHGIDHFSVPEPSPTVRTRRQPYLVALGNTKPYKNLPTLLRALALLGESRPEVELLIVGRGDHMPELGRLAKQLKIEHRISYLGMLSDPQLRSLIAGARALVFPSRIEGFGLPLLEAMALGCPVVSSEIPVVREVVDDAAVLVPPLSADALARAIEAVLSDTALAERLRRAGRKRASEFRWERTVRSTVEIYDRQMPRNGAPACARSCRTP